MITQIPKKENIIKLLSDIFNKEEIIESARWYGSSLYSKDAIDFDIAVMIPSSKEGVVNQSIYIRLRKLREDLCKLFNIDVDLIPHTEDEIKDIRSPLWTPRNNPSLIFGIDIKNKFPVSQASTRPHYSLVYSDLVVIILHENRTITRRQLFRSLENQEGRIFIAKLSHGPANILTYLFSKTQREYKADPSNIEESFKIFDSFYKVDSRKILLYIRKCKDIISDKGSLPLKMALNLISWYECLLSSILEYDLNALKNFLSRTF